ncbi:MAG: right-handed parallel beta-helix repeat-containing protein [Desulfuromonadales bacterium]|nr:MAG: right-handed parallel beta-helix repeat-containing protein [Desulfuromonadales bacterium]
MAGEGGAITYYVDAVNGNDSYDGMSPEMPWKTISKVNATPFQPDDTILFKMGQLWREQLIPSSSGLPGYPITYGSYGTGAKPVISGADVVNGLPYIVNDTFTGNALRKWVPGRGTVVANNDRLEVAIDNVDNTSGDYITMNTPEVKDAWLMFRINLVKGYSWQKEQGIFGSGIINGALVGLVNSNGATMWRIRVERDGGYDYYIPAVPSLLDGIWYDVKLHVKRATAPGANDGMVEVWVNGSLIFSLNGIDNDTRALSKISMGNTYYAPAGVTMQMYLDNVKYSNRELDGTETSSWLPTGVNASDGAAIHKGYAFFNSSTLFENRTPLKKVTWNTDLATTASALKRGTWTIDTKNWVIYVVPSAGDTPDANLYEATTRPNCILVDAKNYTKYQGLEIKNSDKESLYFRKVTGIELDGILAHRNGSQVSTIQGQTASDVYIHDSEFRDSTWNGVSVDCSYGDSSDIRLENNTVYNNVHNGFDFKAVGNYTYSNVTVAGNRAYGNTAHGLYMQNYSGGGANNATIAHNAFYRNNGAGVFIHKNATGQEHTGLKIYNNTFAFNGAVGGYGPGLQLEAIFSDVKNNSFFTNSVTAATSSEYRIAGSGNTSDYNNSFDRYRATNLYENGTQYTFSAFQDLGYEEHGISQHPRFNGEFTNDYTLKWNSPSIDVGTTLPGRTTDILGNPIYGPPDMGAFEFQPPYTMGVNKPDINANVRVYADGKFRNTTKPSGKAADLVIAPEGGFGSGTYDAWLDIVVTLWEKSGAYGKRWRESSPRFDFPATTVHTLGDLEPNRYYAVAVDALVGSGITGPACSAGICLSDSQGKITFTYSGAYTGGSHSFAVTAGGTPP